MFNNPEKKIPKKRLHMKRDPYILSEEERQIKKLKNRIKNKKYIKIINQELETE